MMSPGSVPENVHAAESSPMRRGLKDPRVIFVLYRFGDPQNLPR